MRQSAFLSWLAVGALTASTSLALSATQGSTQGCSCGDESGVLWSGNKPISLPEIAEIAAPVLWFSPDEPLLERDDVPAIPMAHPCDTPSSTAVVYYQVAELVYRSEKVNLPLEEDPQFIDKVDTMVLKYFFYYPEDIGLGAHTHDLEVVEMEVLLENLRGCYQLRIRTVTGQAHGSRWYANKLTIEKDAKFPMTIMVEEGKHGSCPDRNSDGIYTRGYDVNHTVNDAWGVRDIMGSGLLLSSAYNSEMTKLRKDDHRLLPPKAEVTCVPHVRSSTADRPQGLGRYELRSGHQVRRCEEVPVDRKYLIALMDQHNFGREREPGQHSSEFGYKALDSLKSPGSFLSVSLRSEGRLGLSLVFKGLDMRQGWIVPKVNVNSFAASIGAMYTPSASRFLDYYIAAGPRYQYEAIEAKATIETEEGPKEITFTKEPNWDFYWEVGLKIRANVPGKMRPFVLGYHFAGVRVGVQALGIGRLDDIRIVFEIGAGAW